MSNLPTSCLQRPFQLTAAAQFTVTDSDNPLGHAVVVADAWYRMFLSYSAAAGLFEASPENFILAVVAALGDLWVVQLLTTGYIKITYAGTGTGVIAWSTGTNQDTTIRNLLGFTGNVSLGAGASVTATYQPRFCVFNVARGEGDTGWTSVPESSASDRMPSGVVQGWGDGLFGMERRLNLEHHPKTITQQSSSLYATPMYPVASRIQQPPTLISTAPPYSVYEFIRTSRARRLAGLIGTFQLFLAASVTTYDVFYLMPETIASRGQPTRQFATYDPLWKWEDIGLSWVGEETYG